MLQNLAHMHYIKRPDIFCGSIAEKILHDVQTGSATVFGSLSRGFNAKRLPASPLAMQQKKSRARAHIKDGTPLRRKQFLEGIIAFLINQVPPIRILNCSLDIKRLFLGIIFLAID
jgi:hypothetical protein